VVESCGVWKQIVSMTKAIIPECLNMQDKTHTKYIIYLQKTKHLNVTHQDSTSVYWTDELRQAYS